MARGTLQPNREIHSDLKSHRIRFEEEHPIRWPFMKILRETSNLKEFYPEINPYVEAYKVRDNTWALFQESMDGAGDVWMYLIDGPQKAMLIDTGFGVGDLKGLVHRLVGDKDLIVVNTHHHPDHSQGNGQFERVYCLEDEAYCLKQMMHPHLWDRLFDEQGHNIYTEFDRNDIINYHDFELCTFQRGHRFDLGKDYAVEAIPLRGHSSGQCGYLDHMTRNFFIGDITGVSKAKDPHDPYACNGNVETLRDDIQIAVERNDEYDALFPGHGMFDVTKTLLQYELDTLNAILEHPDRPDYIDTIERDGRTLTQYRKNIHQGTAVRYSMDCIYRPK